jgi:hypothetical protein
MQAAERLTDHKGPARCGERPGPVCDVQFSGTVGGWILRKTDTYVDVDTCTRAYAGSTCALMLQGRA